MCLTQTLAESIVEKADLAGVSRVLDHLQDRVIYQGMSKLEQAQ